MRVIQPFYALLVGLLLSLVIMGCQTQPQPTVEPTPTENVVVEVITSTTVPTFAPTETSEATITPLATFTPIGLESPTPTPKATSTRLPTKIPATKAPTVEQSATPAPTATPPVQYPAPQAMLPASGDSNRDGVDIQFQYGAVGPLRGTDCYLLSIQMVNPGAPSGGVAGDTFLDTPHCGDQSQPGKPLKFVLYRPAYHNVYTYGTLERNAQSAGPTDHLNLVWSVSVVQNNGLGPDGAHYDTTPLSPNSATLQSVFFP